MQATVEITEQEYKALESHVKRAFMFDKMGFATLTAGDKILGRLYLALEIQRAPKEAQEQPEEGLKWG